MTLEVKGINAFYGDSHVLFDVNLNIGKGETVCIIGRNGAGKSTLMKAILGSVTVKSGQIIYENTDITKFRSYKIAQSGIAYAPQDKQVFSSLTVRENLMIGERKTSDVKNEWTLSRVYDLFPILKKRQNQKGTTLSGGEQQMLIIARALMQNPKLLLFDEITAGLAPLVVQNILEVLLKIKEAVDMSILIAEQNHNFAFTLCDRCYVLERGAVVYSGNTKEISMDEIKKYLTA